MINKLFHPVVGGIEITITQLCEAIAKDPNFKITVLTSNEKRFSKSLSYRWKNAQIHKISSLGILFSTPIALKFPSALKKLIEEHDVFHFHIPNPVGELSFFVNKIPSHKKVIVTVHADVSQTKKKMFAPAYNYVLKKLLGRADIITASAPQNIEGFPILKNYQHKCISIPLAYDQLHVSDINKEKQDTFKQTFHLSPDKKTILFVGRLSYYKGISFLIDAMPLIINAQLLIVGDGSLKVELKKQVQKLQLTDSIYFAGKLPDDLLATAYSLADIFVFPSIKKAETFGIVQAEAMAYGIPIVNTNLNTGVNFVSIHNETGLTVPPNNSSALQTAINQILSDEQLRKAFSDNAKKKSILFSPEKMAEAYKKLYTQ